MPPLPHLRSCIGAGELGQARGYFAHATADNKPAVLLFFDGEWELARKQLTAASEQSRTSGNGMSELWIALDLARLCRFSGERAQAKQFLQRALEISVDGGDIVYELTTRSALAAITADAGNTREALPHLQRCRQIVGAGENWLGLAGSVERAEAVEAAAQRKYAVPEGHFEKRS